MLLICVDSLNSYINAYLWVFFLTDIAYTANNILYKLYTKMMIYF